MHGLQNIMIGLQENRMICYPGSKTKVDRRFDVYENNKSGNVLLSIFARKKSIRIKINKKKICFSYDSRISFRYLKLFTFHQNNGGERNDRIIAYALSSHSSLSLSLPFF
ncbi:Vesicle-trafficking protein SEC22b-B [Sarcoptes scabiei]|nr:Vesicle-trafficking protein SEC22b-B [Sarcoptes scabiei]